MKNLLDMAIPKFSFFASVFNYPLIMLSTVPAVIVAKVVSFESMIYILGWFVLGDLVSGLCAAYFDWKKSNHTEKWFFGNGEGFSSDKFKKMFVKIMVYLAVPFLLVKTQHILMIKNFKYEKISDAEFQYATIAVIIFCLNEGFSIFHENLPRCGFNLWQSIKRMFTFYKKVKQKINEV